MVRLTDRPNMTLDVYRGLKQQYNNNNNLPTRSSSIIGVEYRVPAFIWYVLWELLPWSMETDRTSIGCETVVFYITDGLILLS